MADILIRRQTQNVDERLTGNWRNQLGSELRLVADGEGGLRGGFRNAIGVGAGERHDLVGCYDPASAQDSTVLAFVVEWPAAHSVTAWSGQFHPEEGTITASWVMTSEAGPGDEWKATLVGRDVFWRNDGDAVPSDGAANQGRGRYRRPRPS